MALSRCSPEFISWWKFQPEAGFFMEGFDDRWPGRVHWTISPFLAWTIANTESPMKKKRDRTRSSTPSSTGSGKIKTTSGKRAILGRLMILEDKVSGLYRSLIEGDLGESVTVQNLVKSQQGLMSELDGIKRFVANGIRELEKQKQDAALTVLRIEHQLRDLNGTMNGCEKELAAFATALTKLGKEKQKHGTNKGKKTRPNP